MNIGMAAKVSGISAKMIRHYEKIGLIPEAARTQADYRLYGEDDVHRLQFIGRARELGFSMDEIRDLLNLWNDKSRHSADVKRLAAAHLANLAKRIEELQQLASTLKTLIDSCAGDHRPDCPIIGSLEQADIASNKGS